MLGIYVKYSFLLSGKISPWTGRFYSLLDPSYAKNNIPIIASVSEHQPTTWSSYYFDLQLLVFMFPGLFCIFYIFFTNEINIGRIQPEKDADNSDRRRLLLVSCLLAVLAPH